MIEHIARTAFFVAAVPLLLFSPAGCEKKSPGVAPPPAEVTVSRPLRKRVVVNVEYTGSTKAAESVEIRARVEGFLQRVHFGPSSMVKRGQLLFTIDPRPFAVKQREAQADLAIRKAERQLAQATLTRKANAFKERAVSEVEVIQARAELAKADAAVAAAEAKVNAARIDLGYTRIASPIAGRIGRSLKDTGNLVGAGEKTLLATVISLDPIHVYFNISEKDLLRFMAMTRAAKQGKMLDGIKETKESEQSVIYLGLAGEEGYPHKGHADYIDNRVDPGTGTIQVRGVFPNPEKQIVPGLFARIQLPLGEQDALLVPESALSADQAGRYLLVVDDKQTVVRRNVKVGVLDQGMRVILDGLGQAEQVIVKGLQHVQPGHKARPIPAGGPQATAESAAPE